MTSILTYTHECTIVIIHIIYNVICTYVHTYIHTHTHSHALLLTDEDITGGKVSGLVTFGSTPFEQTYDICDLVEYVDLSCPIKKGTFSVGYKINVPDFVPSVRSNSHIHTPLDLVTHTHTHTHTHTILLAQS